MKQPYKKSDSASYVILEHQTFAVVDRTFFLTFLNKQTVQNRILFNIGLYVSFWKIALKMNIITLWSDDRRYHLIATTIFVILKITIKNSFAKTMKVPQTATETLMMKKIKVRNSNARKMWVHILNKLFIFQIINVHHQIVFVPFILLSLRFFRNVRIYQNKLMLLHYNT